MSSLDAIRWSGVAALIAAVLLPFDVIGCLFPKTYLSLFITISNVGYVFLIFTFSGIGTILLDKIGMLGFIIVITGTVGSVLLCANGVVSAYIYPGLDEAIVATLQGSTGMVLVSLLGRLSLLIAVTLLAVTTVRTDPLPHQAAWLMFAGVLLYDIVGMTMSTILSDPLALIGDLIFSAGLAWIGLVLLSLNE